MCACVRVCVCVCVLARTFASVYVPCVSMRMFACRCAGGLAGACLCLFVCVCLFVFVCLFALVHERCVKLRVAVGRVLCAVRGRGAPIRRWGLRLVCVVLRCLRMGGTVVVNLALSHCSRFKVDKSVSFCVPTFSKNLGSVPFFF